MCGGNRRRAARYGGACSGYGGCGRYNTFGAGCHDAQPRIGVLALIEGVQQMRHASKQRAMGATAATPKATDPAHTDSGLLDAQTQGVTNDEKKRIPAEIVDFEELPSYQEIVNLERSGTLAREGVPTNTAEAHYVPASIESSRGLDQRLPVGGLDKFKQALASYRQGECGGRCRAKKAAKDIVRELVHQEITRLEAANGRLKCGQRKQIRREAEPVKDMLKGALREARRERSCC